jgi:hypothetical protein
MIPSALRKCGIENYDMLSDPITMNNEDHRLLTEGARKFGVTLSEKQVYLFALFLEGLWFWNRQTNITGISEKREMIIKLLVDPLVAVPYLSLRGTNQDSETGV